MKNIETNPTTTAQDKKISKFIDALREFTRDALAEVPRKQQLAIMQALQDGATLRFAVEMGTEGIRCLVYFKGQEPLFGFTIAPKDKFEFVN